MKVYIVVNLDRDWSSGILAVHKSKHQAEITLKHLPDKIDRQYGEIIEMEVEE